MLHGICTQPGSCAERRASLAEAPMSPAAVTLAESPPPDEGGPVDLVQTIVNVGVVGSVGAVLGFLVHGLRREVREDIAGIRREIGDLRHEVAGLRSDLTQVALAVGARPRADRNR